MWWFVLIGAGLTALAHTWPARFLLEVLARDRTVWHMPRGDPPTVYLTYDDGPNPSTTPELLDVLGRERVQATFFLIDSHITDETAPIVRRIVEEGHAIGLHSGTRAYMLKSPQQLAAILTAAARRIESISGVLPCRAFRPHAGWRSGQMYEGLRRIDYRLVGWGWMLWDWNWFRARTAESAFNRIVSRASAGDIVVMHDGDHAAPLRYQGHTVEATIRLVPALRARGLTFGTVCRNGE